MYCLVSTFSKTFDELGLIYFIPSFLEKQIKTGQIVEIPMGTKTELAVVLEIGKLEKLNSLNISEEKIKSIITIKNNAQFLNSKQIEITKFIAKYYFTHIHNSISLFFPKNLREKIDKEKIASQLISQENEKLKYNFDFDKQLSKKQKEIFEKINLSTEDFNPMNPLPQSSPLMKKELGNNKFLLHGITGSGKTEIYIKLIKQQLDIEKQSLLLIPEIILTNQLEERLKKVFGENVLVINSSITEASKTKAWVSIYQNDSKIIIGTRSALFYPYSELGLIIIDEEHDNSYISDQAPRYNSIEVANKITDLYGNKLLLASGTPSIKSMYNAVKGRYELLRLLEKFDK